MARIRWKASQHSEAVDAKGKPIRETVYTAEVNGGVLRVVPDVGGESWSWFVYDADGQGLQDMRVGFPDAESAMANAEHVLSS